jgi:integrase
MLRAAQGDRLEALYVLAVHTGMRKGELLALEWPT